MHILWSLEQDVLSHAAEVFFGHSTAWYYGISVAVAEVIDFRRRKYRYLNGAGKANVAKVL